MPKPEKLIGRIGVATSDLWEWTIHYRTLACKKANDSSPALEASIGQRTTVEGKMFKVG